MEEKKLTDEEVAKAILKSIECSKTITYFDEWGNCKTIMVTDILDLINRLQAENERLKCDTYRTSWKAKFLEAEKELERLKKRHGVALLRNDDLDLENYELKKQVDELTAKNEHLDSENTRLICEMDKMLDDGWDIMDEEADGWYKKGVKDTAKEICDLILEHWEKKQFVECDWLRVAISEKYGVEVE